MIDVDIFQTAVAAKALEEFLFAEDVRIRDATDEMYHLAAHGPAAAELIAEVTGDSEFRAMERFRARSAAIAGKNVTVARRDQIGEPGFVLLLARADARDVWQALVNVGEAQPNVDVLRLNRRPIGWYAWNIARIEAGTPMMNIDFDTTCLPHETNLVDERVSFRKGCYPGQEIVARMQHLGGPKQKLFGLRVQGLELPVAGSDVYPKPAEGEGNFDEPIGVITSSALSPMLSAQPIAFAMLRAKDIKEGGIVMVMAENAVAEATVGPLVFWSRQERAG